ncbi:MAG: EF-P 5-aminopentanol modification-associated protein YfmF [Oscillospiraceae bacterium]
MIRKQINDNVFFNYIKDDKFKTNRVSVHLITNLSEESSTYNALLSFVLKRGNSTYNNYKDFTKKLYSLYGASFECDIDKFANKQVLSMSIQTVDNKFSIGEENVLKDMTTLLFETLLNPNFKDNNFSEDTVNIEKENLKETILSVINDKRTYVVKKAKDILFKGTSLSVSRYGNLTKLDEIDNVSLTESYYDLIKNCKIEIVFAGCGDKEISYNLALDYFKNIDNNNFKLNDFNVSFNDFSFVQESEKMDITQSKVCLLYTGFKADNLKESSIMRVANAIFGGSPFSKLFINVREKQSLCYYCDSFFDRFTGVMSVDCGVNLDKIDIAIETINEQISLIAGGQLTNKEIDETKLLIVNAFKSVKDRLSSIEGFYLGQILNGTNVDIDAQIEEILKITKEDVENAFKNCNLKTVYKITEKVV